MFTLTIDKKGSARYRELRAARAAIVNYAKTSSLTLTVDRPGQYHIDNVVDRGMLLRGRVVFASWRITT